MRTNCCVVVVAVCVCLAFALSQEYEYEEYEDGTEDLEDFSNVNSTSNGTLSFTKELINVTRLSGKVVKFICEVQDIDLNNTNKKVTFTWLKNLAPVEKEKRISIKTTKEKEQKFKSILRVANLDIFDKGFYECIANNGEVKIKSQAFLEVSESSRGGSTIGHPLRSEDIDGESAFGEMTTFIPNIYLSPKFGKEFSTSGVFEPNLLDTDGGDVIPNRHISGGGSGGGSKHNNLQPSLQFDLTSTGKMISELPVYNASEPMCQLYRGKKCKTYLENQYVFVQPPYTQANIEKKLEDAFLVISQSQDISSSCNKFAQPSLCYSAFPICLDAKQVNTYQAHSTKEIKAKLKDKATVKDIRKRLTNYLRRICKTDCILLETELCSKEYAIAKRHPVIGQTLELEECQFLPEEESTKHCLNLGVGIEHINPDNNCFWDDGESYRGIQNMSVTVEKCLRWAYQFHIPLSEHPELTGHNYCRNPGGIETEPFCFVDQNRKEHCGIRKCANIVAIYIVASFVVLLVIVLVTTYLCCKKKHKAARNLQNMNVPTANKNIYGNPGPNSPMEMNTLLPMNIPPARNHHVSKGNYQNVPQYTYKELSFVEELGEGAFGKVYKGELKTKAGKIFVAVKSLKENASAKTQADFQREIELISELKHPNIICLVGVVTKQEPVCMLFEFMSEGDLHEFLIANSPGEGKALSQFQFLNIAIQIAQGMEYLSENHYVHRDLAARNCLVSTDLVVKISDFGLSRDMYSCDYYRVQSKSLLPVRWMPPESILYGKFTTESDVWSYGVVLWEIYSYGLQPYYGYNNQEVINMIRSRKLLPCPDACPSYCYSLMVECWAELAVRRPSFGEITYRLRVWKQNGNSNGAYFKTPENYPNSQQRFGHSSKSSHTSDSQTLCPVTDATPEHSMTWERNLKSSKPHHYNHQTPSGGSGSGRPHHESQSSLSSRTSSLGNRTQSTSLSNEHKGGCSVGGSGRKSGRHERGNKKNEETPDKSSLSLKNTVIVSSNGDNFETKVTL